MTWSRYIIAGMLLWVALSQVARGQDTTKFILDLSKKLQFITIRPHIVDTILLGSATIPYYRTSKDSNDRPQVIRVVTTSDWDEWIDSCWADSSAKVRQWHAGQSWYPNKWYNQREINNMYKYTDLEVLKWTHRDPNDLKGFMEFIRRKK